MGFPKNLARDKALVAGQKTYDTGERCHAGHLSPRRTDSRRCCECQRIASRKYAKAHKEQNRQRTHVWYHTLAGERKANLIKYRADYYAANRERLIENSRIYYHEHKECKDEI